MMFERLPEDNDLIEPSAETNELVIDDRSKWEFAASEDQAIEYDGDLPWHSIPEIEPAESPISYEVPMYYKEDPEPVYERGIDMMPLYEGGYSYEDKYPIASPPILDPTVYSVPPPIVEPPIISQTPVLPVDVPVQTLPPVISVNVGSQTPTTQQAADDPALIFGYPWYYVAGAAAVGLFLISSMDGKN